MNLGIEFLFFLAIPALMPLLAAVIVQDCVTRSARVAWRFCLWYYATLISVYAVIYGIFFATGQEVSLLQGCGCGLIVVGPIVMAVEIGFVIAHARRRGAATLVCEICGYDLRGAAHGACPECGHVPGQAI